MPLKLSNYVVAVGPITDEFPWSKLVHSTRSGETLRVHLDVWDSIEAGNVDDLSASELATFVDAEILVPADEDELSHIIQDNKAWMADSQSLYMVVQPTANCQLGCSYCGQRHTAQLMSSQDQDSFVYKVEEKLRAGQDHYRELIIGWFGGEPLLGLNVIRSLTPRLKAVAQRYLCAYEAKLVTNGLSLSVPIATELVRTLGVTKLEITLDGPGSAHDSRRFLKNRQPTFDLIYNNLKKVASEDLPVKLTVRCNVDSLNFESVDALIDLLIDDQLHTKVSLYMMPVYSWGNDAHKSSLTPDRFAELELGWIKRLLNAGFSSWLLPRRRHRACIAVSPDSELVDAFGEYYKCTEVSYVPIYGNPNIYRSQSVPSRELSVLLTFNDDVQAGVYPCSTCRILPVCGGACPKRWDEGLPPCPSVKWSIENRIVEAFRRHK
ncbi:MAG: radical SAM protein [Pirellulales bacterium]